MLLILIMLLACGHINPPKRTVNTKKLAEFARLVNNVKMFAPTCQYPNGFVGPSKDTCISEGTGTGDGDMMKFGGLLCLARVESACELVRRSCDHNGKCWRSPARVNNDTEPTFSRDQWLGLLAYFIATKDIDLWNKVMAYHQSIGWKVCDENNFACDARVTHLSLTGRVSEYLGLGNPWKQFVTLDDLTMYLSARLAPNGYELELIVTKIFLRQVLDQYTPLLQSAAHTAMVRQPQNPWFAYVYEGISDKVLDLAISQIPRHNIPVKDQWSFEVANEEAPWNRTMIWEWIFLKNLMFD